MERLDFLRVFTEDDGNFQLAVATDAGMETQFFRKGAAVSLVAKNLRHLADVLERTTEADLKG